MKKKRTWPLNLRSLKGQGKTVVDKSKEPLPPILAGCRPAFELYERNEEYILPAMALCESDGQTRGNYMLFLSDLRDAPGRALARDLGWTSETSTINQTAVFGTTLGFALGFFSQNAEIRALGYAEHLKTMICPTVVPVFTFSQGTGLFTFFEHSGVLPRANTKK